MIPKLKQDVAEEKQKIIKWYLSYEVYIKGELESPVSIGGRYFETYGDVDKDRLNDIKNDITQNYIQKHRVISDDLFMHIIAVSKLSA